MRKEKGTGDEEGVMGMEKEGMLPTRSRFFCV